MNAIGKFGIASASVYKLIEHYNAVFTTLPLDESVILEALRGVGQHKLSYFDAQIWACAKLNHIATVLSEDFNTGTTLEGVKFENPLLTIWQLN